MKKAARQQGMLLRLLPAALREEIESLATDRDDNSVSAEQWHTRADALMSKAASMPGPVREAFIRSIRDLAKGERAEEMRTGRLVGLSADADESWVRQEETDLRRRLRDGELTDSDKAEIEGRIRGN